MISGLDNNKYISLDVLKLSSKSSLPNLPQENSIVTLKVVEKFDALYKVLINGEVFQTKLPIDVNIGDFLIGKVITNNPLTIGLDNFGQLKFIDQQVLVDIIKKLGIKVSKTSLTVIEKLIVSKKTLVKSKVEDMLSLIDNDIEMLDYQIGILIGLMWNATYHKKEDLYEVTKILKEIPFDKLCNEIFLSIIRINGLNLPNSIYNAIAKVFFININEDNISNLAANKNSLIVDLILNLSGWAEQYSSLKTESDELNYLVERLIKYHLQKKIYSTFNFFPDFYIIINNKELDLVVYSYEQISGSLGNKYFKTDIICGNNNKYKGSIDGVFINTGFAGKMNIIDSVTTDKLSIFDNLINKIISKTNLSINLHLSQGYSTPEFKYQAKADLLNIKA